MSKAISLARLKEALAPLVALIGKKAEKSSVYSKEEMAPVATSGQYADLEGTPDLAAVATSGRYADLTGKPSIPTVPTDIVKYTAQSLTTAQKSQARENIGAGTSSFDGAYSSLTGAPSLADVATSGEYDDLVNAPVGTQYVPGLGETYTWDGNTSASGMGLVKFNGVSYYEAAGIAASDAELVGAKYVYDGTEGVLEAAEEEEGKRCYSGMVVATDDGLYFYKTGSDSASYKWVESLTLNGKAAVPALPLVLPSSTEGSTKKFVLTVDDSGAITATEAT